jgi:shikimate kinase/shikimate kinase/3-dehydroquinate synthase
MKSKGNIVFLGMMGSGKSSIGKLVSKKLELNFFDIDQKIEEKFKMTIPKIFSEKGESFFRKVEEKITLDILKKKRNVVALGGGGFLNKKVREEVVNNHLSFWLNYSSKILIDRIKNSYKRPLAFNSTINELNNLIEKRSNIYSKALFKVDCDNLTKTEISKKIINIYENTKANN